MKRFLQTGLSLLFYSLFLAFSLVGVPLLALFVAGLSPFLSHRQVLRRVRRAISWYGKVVIFILPFPWIRIRYRDFGKADGPGPFLFVCNHRSLFDPFMMACLPNECVQVVNKWPFRLPLLGLAAKLGGYLSVREMPPEVFMSRVAALIGEGVSVIAFPEGTRSGSREMGHFHGMVFRVALATQAPIVPICLSGTENRPPRGSLLLEPGVITMHRLSALRWKDYRDLDPFQLKNKIRDIIARELAVMEGGR